MSKENKAKVSVKKTASLEETISFFEDLLESFKAGKIVLQDGENSATMFPADEIKMELNAKVKKQKSKIKLELSWKEIPGEATEVIVTEKGSDEIEEAIEEVEKEVEETAAGEDKTYEL